MTTDNRKSDGTAVADFPAGVNAVAVALITPSPRFFGKIVKKRLTHGILVYNSTRTHKVLIPPGSV